MNNFQIDHNLEGLTLSAAIKNHIGTVPASLLNKLTRKGIIRINGKRCKPNTLVQNGDMIKIPELDANTQPKKTSIITQDELAAFKDLILYEDQNLFVLNKPEGLAVQGGTHISKHIDAYLDALAAEGMVRPHIVHRLDRGTSGILLIAKSPRAAAQLSEIIRNGEMKKTYLALIVGKPEHLKGTINLPLSKSMQGPYERVVTDTHDAKEAITDYRVLKSNGTLSLIELTPHTGRTHQLRAHCAYGLKMPILGDTKYGGPLALPYGKERGFYLHASHLRIPEISLDIQIDMPIKFFSYVNNLDGVL